MKRYPHPTTTPRAELHVRRGSKRIRKMPDDLVLQYTQLGFHPPKYRPDVRDDLSPISFQTFIPYTVTSLG